MTAALSVATWNIEWQPSCSAAAAILRERLQAGSPDIICLTEAYADFFTGNGHVIEAAPDYGYPLVEGRRKALLWSRRPWEESDPVGHPDLPPGRFISGRTETRLGPLTVIGICIPWREAHVRSGRRHRQPWEDHLAYLKALKEVLRGRNERTLVIGDFNQRIPRQLVPAPVHQALLDCFAERFVIATRGPVEPAGTLAIDHIAHSRDLTSLQMHSLSAIGPGGEPLSDHFGVAAILQRIAAGSEERFERG